MRFIEKIQKSELFKFSSLNAISVFVKIATGLITSKLLAVFVGPSGMALIGNFRNFIATVESLGTLGFQNGIIKIVVEAEKKEERLQKIFSTLLACLLFVSFLLGIVLFFFSDYWNNKIFGNTYQYQIVFKILAIIFPLYIASLYVLSIINGFQKFKDVLRINIFGYLLSVAITPFLVWKFSVLGAFVSIILTPVLLFFISMFYLNKEVSLKDKLQISLFDFSILKDLSSYFVMTLVSGVIGSLVYIGIRNTIIQEIGIKEAGFWEAISRISTYYLLFVNTILSVYYYPKLVEAQTNKDIKEVIWAFYKNILIYFGIALFLVYILRDFIIQILFTSEFKPVTNLFFWQLIGDFLKTGSWILGLLFFAKKLTKGFIITELFSLSILYFSSLYFLSIYNIEGVVIANAFTYFIYFFVLIVYFRKSFFD